MKTWTATGEPYYSFLIEEKETGNYDLTVSYLGSNLNLWFRSLAGAKRHVSREYKGLKITRWKVSE